MYTEKVMDHFQHPRNVGEIENASGVGTVGKDVYKRQAERCAFRIDRGCL